MAESQTEPVGTQYKFMDNFMGGIRKDLRSAALPDNAGLIVSNVTLREGLVEVDNGYAQFMNTVEGQPQAIFQINYPNGTSDMILVTTETVFERLAGQWVYSIGSDGTNIHRTTLTAAVAASETIPLIGAFFKLFESLVSPSSTKSPATGVTSVCDEIIALFK